MSYLKQTSGAKIYISTLPYTQDFQICHMEGESDVSRSPNASCSASQLTCGRLCRDAAAGGQGPVPDREKVQGAGPEQSLRPPSAPAHPPLAAHDLLGKWADLWAGPEWVGHAPVSPVPPLPSCCSPAG